MEEEELPRPLRLKDQELEQLKQEQLLVLEQ